jgi:hypothetical protein
MVSAAPRPVPEPIGEIPEFEAHVPQRDNAGAMKVLLLLLQTASQRTVVALSNLVTLMVLGCGFWLWLQSPENPSITHLVQLGLFGMFGLGLRFVWRK